LLGSHRNGAGHLFLVGLELLDPLHQGSEIARHRLERLGQLGRPSNFSFGLKAEKLKACFLLFAQQRTFIYSLRVNGRRPSRHGASHKPRHHELIA